MSDGNELNQLKEKLEALRAKKGMDSDDSPDIDSEWCFKMKDIKQRRRLKGHFGKIYACHWGGDSIKVASASQDGKLILWNGLMQLKDQSIPLRSSWVMTCGMERSTDGTVAAGGLDNICSIYELGSDGMHSGAAKRELTGHDGYLSCCRFIGKEHIITSSGDSTCIRWDIETGAQTNQFSDHFGDVMSVSLCPTDQNLFASGSCDATSMIFDIRTGSTVCRFEGHESDINSVDFCANGYTIATGSDDSSCRMFDIRARQQIGASCSATNILCGITSVGLSASGRFLIGGYDDYNVRMWGAIEGSVQFSNMGHTNRVSCIGINPEGSAICSGSWDTELSILA